VAIHVGLARIAGTYQEINTKCRVHDLGVSYYILVGDIFVPHSSSTSVICPPMLNDLSRPDWGRISSV
jgi:hypothetical protein